LTNPLPADQCTTMAEVREGVDALDRELVALLARRQTYMDAAARIKPKRDQVRDEARINQVICNVTAAAVPAGLSPRIAEAVWRVLIEQSIAYEMGVWEKMRR